VIAALTRARARTALRAGLRAAQQQTGGDRSPGFGTTDWLSGDMVAWLNNQITIVTTLEIYRPMGDLYDTDLLIWTEHQADLLRRLAAGKHVNEQVDWANVAEEIEAFGKSQSL
jgi:hypothetical protein